MQVVRLDRCRLEVGGRSLHALPYYGSPPFFPYAQRHRVAAPLGRIEDGGAARGKLCFGTCRNEELPRWILRGQEAGCAGLLIVTGQPTDHDLLAPLSPPFAERIEALRDTSLPVLGVSQATGEILARSAEHGREARVDIDVGVETTSAKNLFVRFGDGAPAAVRVAVHYDSAFEHPAIPGASDNASGVAAVLAVLRRLAQRSSGSLDLEFVFYDAEEYGLYGCLSLFVDLGRDPTAEAFARLGTALGRRPAAGLPPRPQPGTVIEVDTVGRGRQLFYGTSDPQRVGRMLRQADLGRQFEKVILSRSKGNLELLSATLGRTAATDFHFLTLGDRRIVHTASDDLENLVVEDVCAFAEFLEGLIPLVLP